MGKSTRYLAREPAADGYIDWRQQEHATWQALMARQRVNLPGRACDEYLQGLACLDLPEQRIPQLGEVSEVLRRCSGWVVEPVPALISFDRFFALLADRRFPVATFIRRPEEMDYLQEPDIFHEIFGHCPLLTNRAFGDFTQIYGELGKQASAQERVYLARLYWFTVEFGLLLSDQGLRIYGGGILSSPGETRVALTCGQAVRHRFELMEVLRTPYRIDIMQPIYFVIDSIDELYRIGQLDIMARVRQAMKLGLLPARFAKSSV